MTPREHSDKQQPDTSQGNQFRLAPIAQAIALTLAAGGLIGNAYAAQPFSAGWYGARGALQETARTTGLVNGKPVSSLTNPAVQQQQANAQLQQSIANLGLAARGIALQQASQALQRAALRTGASAIPDGLGAGGLDTGSLAASWINAGAPTQTTDANGKIVVGINQTADKAIANWESFNVGKNTIVQFNQSSSDWAILNRITDPLAAPSQIQGQIRAPGTVLIVNRNGIVFSGTSQINTRNLVAAAAEIRDSQFTANGIYGASQAASFTNASGALVVEQGAQITTSTPSSVTQGGGYVLLMGKQVTNSGDIETPQGQIEMAAGDKFIIRKGVGTDANQASTTRGNEISPQFVIGSTAGQVVNTETGLLVAREGDITLAGRDVQQNGVAVSTTNVNTRGTIHLLNSAGDATGSVTLGGKSITSIVLDDDGATALDSQRDALIAASLKQDPLRASSSSGVFDNLSKQTDREDQSRIEIVSGGNVQFADGSLTLATGGQIAVSAANRTFAATGSVLDVSGAVGVNLTMASNNVVVNVQGNELRDSPDNRDNGNLFNNNITVDRRDLIEVKASAADPTDRWYTANGLLEVGGYLNNQTHGIGEWAAQGGKIQLGGKEVIAQTGSQVNLSGGTLNVATGYVAQTWLIGSDGNLYNADNAPANMTFKGVYKGFEVSHTRWGADASEFYYNPLIAPQQRLENGYTVGRDAGQLIVDAPTAVMEGDVIAHVYNGPQQVRARDAVDGYAQAQTAVAKAGTVSFGQYGPGGLLGVDGTDIEIGDVADITGGMTADTALSADRANTLWLDAGRLSAAGLGELDLGTSGTIKIAAPLTLAHGGTLSMVSPDVDIAADITIASGNVSATSVLLNTPLAAPADAKMTVEGIAAIDVRGLWVNNQIDPDSGNGLAWLNGGNVAFDSVGDLTLAEGSVIDVSSGGAILAGGKTRGGRGGNVTLIAGHAVGSIANAAGALTIDGAIRAAGVNGGGTLTLSSPGNMLIGDNASLSGGVLAAGATSAVTLLLAQPLTIAAGQVLPMTVTYSFSSLAAGVPAPIPLTVDSTVLNQTIGADWLIPPDMGMWGYPSANAPLQRYGGNTLVPAGTIISSVDGTIPVGASFDPQVFPKGVPTQAYKITHAAGTTEAAAFTYPTGTAVAAGTVLPQTVSVMPAPSLTPAFFSAGFSAYDINGGSGVLITDGAVLAPVMPVYRIDGNAAAMPSGSDPSAAMSLWLPPLFSENPQTGTLTQRGGASLTLRSQTTASGVAAGDAIVVGNHATVTVDPGQSITLDAFNQITVDGALVAHGGNISLINEDSGASEQSRNFNQSGTGRGYSLWIGDTATLDVSGAAYGALDARGRRYGIATDGGSISLNGAETFVVVRPGAELNADGTSMVVDHPAGVTQAIPSNGGSIALSSFAGLYLDGNLHAASGGKGAAGGSLSVSLNTQIYPSLDQIVVPANVLVPGTMTLTQSATGSLLPADVTPQTAAASYGFGQTTISADAVKAGGFGSLALNSDDYLRFAGDVSLALDQSLMLTAGAFISGPVVASRPAPTSAPATGHVSLSAPYLLLSGGQNIVPDHVTTAAIGHPGTAGSPTTAVFEANADQIDIRGAVSFSAFVNGKYAPGYQSVNLTSQGDIRFLADGNPKSVATTTLSGDWDVKLVAAQLYPATGVIAVVNAGLNNPTNTATLTIGRISDADPVVPASVFGKLTLSAAVIEQGGIVRAPLGAIQVGTNDPFIQIATQRVELLPGSLTSVSAAGLTMPYGGTIDGVTYSYNGTALQAINFSMNGNGVVAGIGLNGQAINVQPGAVLDLSGGGTLAGEGFISGRGGSVNVLNTPLINANPSTPQSSAGDKVYAIVPGYASGYAPVAPEKGAGDPAIGQQIAIPAGVPGLAAGTYTLLPSTYALMPGAYRVEIGKTVLNAMNGASAIGNGTYATTGHLGVANTDISNALASTVLVTPGTAVRHYSQFDEQSYGDFMAVNTTQFGAVRPLLPSDGKTLMLSFAPASGTMTDPALRFAGTALFQGAQGGFGGQAVINGNSNLEIYADAPTAGFSGMSVAAGELNALAAPRLLIGGIDTLSQQPGSLNLQTAAIISFSGSHNVTIGDGVDLRAGELFLIGANVSVGNNVTLSTVGRGAAPFDSSNGFTYSSNGSTVLALSNGDLRFTGSATSSGTLSIGAGSSLYSEGTLAFATNGLVSLDPGTRFGSRNINLAVGNLNIGSDAELSAGHAPVGLLMDQRLFDTLLHGDPLQGAPALQKLTLSANAINLFGTTGLDARGSGVDLVLATPAIYGVGAAGDKASIAADRIEWDGIAGQNPPAIAAAGPGTGSGSLTLTANEIDLGQFVHLDTSTTSRVTYGFANVNLQASERITAAGNTALSVYQAPGTAAGDVFGKSGSGGNLTLSTPLLTGVQKSVAAYTAGGVLSVTTPDGMTPGMADTTVAGAEIDLNGNSVNIGSTILLPSGKLAVRAVNDIALLNGSRIDLSGQPAVIQTATVYGFGGTVSFDSAQGNITQAGGSTIDVSATRANAGAIMATAGNGHVALSGIMQGAADAGFTSGDFSTTAAVVDDFDGLNARLTQGGIFDARGFDIKSGNLTVGDGVKAHAVTIAVDNGDLTVTGRIDASGAAPGTIRLSANNDLTLTGSAVLDAHGDLLQVDSYGQPIAAKNRGHIELNAAAGTMALQAGATMDVSTPGGMAFGDIVLNAPRTAEASGDIAIAASGPLTIRGAYSVALNAMWTYWLTGGSVITQGTLDGYDVQNLDFIALAYNSNVNAGVLSANLQGKLGGLLTQGAAFHLRPGVQITSDGDLSTSGDIDLSRYRYGPGADRDPNSPTYGAGEPMALTIRAGGDLTIKGSISDGFGQLLGLPAVPGLPASSVLGPAVSAGTVLGSTWTFDYGANGGPTETITILSEWTVPDDAYYSFPSGNYFTSTVGNTYASGDPVPAGTQFVGDSFNSFLAGFPLPSYQVLTDTPATAGTPATPPKPPASAVATLMAPGSLSASVRLVAGADAHAADPRALQATTSLQGKGNLTLDDAGYSPAQNGTNVSVLRTGTGSLDLLAGGNFSETTPFGVYTAGVQSAPLLNAGGTNPYDLIGQTTTTHAWYPEQGGDLLLSAQGDVSGNIRLASFPTRNVDSDLVSNWLWTQGGTGLSNDATAWSVNFGTLANTAPAGQTPNQNFVGFQGIGTLGGGNLTVIAGRNAGALGTSTSSGLDLAVASSGRVLSDGTLVQTGGGDLVLKVGGTVNPFPPDAAIGMAADYFGAITNLRGNISVDAGNYGQISTNRGPYYTNLSDPRTPDIDTQKRSAQAPGPVVLPGDGIVRISTRGDLVFGGAGDAGMIAPAGTDGLPYTQTGTTTPNASGGETHFSLWTPDTAIHLYAAGGDVAPRAGNVESGSGQGEQNVNGFYPGTLSVAAANGDIRFPERAALGSSLPMLEMIPAPDGQLSLLAAGTIYGTGTTIGMSGADMSTLATPFQPEFSRVGQYASSNASVNAAYRTNRFSPIAFGEDTPSSNLHAGDALPALIYAGIDIDDLMIGALRSENLNVSNGFVPDHATWYIGAKPFEVVAGRDIIGSGLTPDVFVNNTPTDISVVRAGRDIIYQGITVAGPGVLDVQAGRNLYQGFYGMLDSVGQLVNVNAANRAGGADIAVAAGVGANGPDYTDFAKLYFDAANQLPAGAVLAGSGKVAHAYDQELLAWLQQRFGYAGTSADALAYFLALPSAQQGIFVRQTYYAELTAGGREFNDASSSRFQSYLRGRDAIAALFPATDAQGKAIDYTGSITMFSGTTINAIGGQIFPDAGIHTDFGGAIQILNPGGQTLIGVEGVAPGAGAGLITQGEGDIDVYSAGSILLGQSRIMTTFGGDILAWSADGDINAGRGSKTTVLFTPPRRVYDEMGDVSLSPQVPSTGAGIATLNPIPEVAAGDVDLIAPLGTIDAGEAGIRVSGNVNLAALQVVNAANIQVQGKSTGLPLIASVNVSALTNASAAATQAAMAAQDVVSRERTAARQALPSIFTVRVLGFGDEPAAGNKATTTPASGPANLQSSAGVPYNAASPLQFVGMDEDFDAKQVARLSENERRQLSRQGR